MVAKDRYRMQGRVYDRLIEPAETRIRRICLAIAPPKPGQRVVDIGCGTGTQLAYYQSAGCEVSGADASATMLELARRKLGDGADLRLESVTSTNFPDEAFDLVMVMFVLHEMPPTIRAPVLQECRRIVRQDGHVLLADYHDGPCTFPKGFVWKGLILMMEVFAGREHFANFRHFMTHHGLPPLLEAQQLRVVQSWISEEGVASVFLARK